jgi:hypothetical protein
MRWFICQKGKYYKYMAAKRWCDWLRASYVHREEEGAVDSNTVCCNEL